MTKTSIKKNYIYNTIYQVINLLTPLITAPYAARIFGADGIGVQSYVLSIVSYFTLFAALGTQAYGQREIAMCRNDKKKSSKTFWEIELMSFLTTLICIIAWGIFVAFAKEYRYFYIVLTVNIITVAFDVSWFFAGYEQFKTIVIRNSVVKLAIIVSLFAFCRDKDDLLLYVFLTAMSGLLGAVSLWTLLPKYLVKVQLKHMHIMKHLKQTIVYFVPAIATTVYTVLDKTMIGVITKDPFENGYYEQATKVTRIATAVITSINGVMYPRMSHLYAENKFDELRERLSRSIDFITILAIPLVIGTMSIAHNFVPLFFGPEYAKVTDILYVYSPLVLIVGVSGCLSNQCLVPIGQRARSSKAIIIGAITNLCLNAILIPMFKSIGAAIASIIAETLIVIMYMYMSKGYTSWKQLWQTIWKRLIAGLVMFPIVFAISYIDLRIVNNVLLNLAAIILLQIIVGVLVYCFMLWLLRDKGLPIYAQILFGKILRKRK